MIAAAFIAAAGLENNSHPGIVLLIVAGVAVLMFAVRGLGLLLAAGHPDAAPPAQTPGPAAASKEVSPVEIAVIAAATSEILGKEHRILSIVAAKPPSVEALMLHWSIEGRRAIYSSHRVR